MCRVIKVCLYIFYIIFAYNYIFLPNEITFIEEINLNYLPVAPGMFVKRIDIDHRHDRMYVRNILPEEFTPHLRLKTDFKYILRWSKAFSHYSSSIFRAGQYAFLMKNCSEIKCFITENKALLGDLRHFDAIIFDVENYWDEYPRQRSEHQKYVFVASESADNYPICGKYFDEFFNWTWSYKVNSDIRWSFVTVFDKKGNVVGPKENMTWVEDMKPIGDDVKEIISNKKRFAAWFVSHCNARSGRDTVTKNLVNALKKYNETIDIYGWCGNLTCSRDQQAECLELLQKEYYFYLSFENSLCEDYVTEKILYPLQNYVVPVVFGGADYSRFLPPGSYLDAGALSSSQLAQKMYELKSNRTLYETYFSWHNHYIYDERPKISDLCTLCSMLHDPVHLNYSVRKHFRKWWLNDYEKLCTKKLVK